jgi:RluA family pseudouridine synthase
VRAPVLPGDEVEVLLRGAETKVPLSRDRILHLDEHLVVVDKPAGVPAQPDRQGSDALPALCAELIGGPALLVHRLDRGTTGATVLARTRASQARLLEEFRSHRVGKEYRALVSGAPKESEGIIDLALGPAPDGSRRADPGGESAVTRFRVLERFDGAALVAAFPETGRTHQVRVHLRELGCPLLGDARYGGPLQLTRGSGVRIDFARPLLHARALELSHPAGGTLRVEAPEAGDFRDATDRLR